MKYYGNTYVFSLYGFYDIVIDRVAKTITQNQNNFLNKNYISQEFKFRDLEENKDYYVLEQIKSLLNPQPKLPPKRKVKLIKNFYVTLEIKEITSQNLPTTLGTFHFQIKEIDSGGNVINIQDFYNSYITSCNFTFNNYGRIDLELNIINH